VRKPPATPARLVALLVALILAAGCGAQPPQAPKSAADALNSALSTVSGACGHAIEARTFGASPRELRRLSDQAVGAAPTLRSVLRRNPRWVYQDRTVAQLADVAVSDLRQCGLPAAADRLSARLRR
jgi:hypothetical protein